MASSSVWRSAPDTQEWTASFWFAPEDFRGTILNEVTVLCVLDGMVVSAERGETWVMCVAKWRPVSGAKRPYR
jgi:hypothetical protein